MEVGHGRSLPEEYAQRIPAEDAQILRFFLSFLCDEGLPDVEVFVNGGYVRDLLLGKCPDDLDLSLCLRDCPAGINVGSLLERVPAYAAARADLGIKQVKLATCLSDESKNKNLDTFKAHFMIAEGGKIEVDVMPTIGDEFYDSESRIPVRGERGTPEQDTLRRDLTIGAMLLRVGSAVSGGLCYELLDYYGGLEDLQRGVLRAPCPHGMDLGAVRAIVLQSDRDRELARSLGIDDLPVATAIQVLWWAKILVDDPLRVSRALRFAAKLRFFLHESFWLAIPFALQALRTKVAGERKFQEYMKIGGYGFDSCADFYELAFSRTFGPVGRLRAAPALFGGQDEKRRIRGLSDVQAFDRELYRALASAMNGILDAAELLGGLLACASFAATFEGAGGAYQAFNEACGGMCVSNAMREAGSSVFQSLLTLEEEPPVPDRLDRGVAAACGVAPEALCLHLHVWDALRLPSHRNLDEDLSAVRRNLVLRMLRKRAPTRSSAVEGCLATLYFARPAVKGGILNTPGLLQVPGPMRQRVMVLIEVALRLMRASEPLENADQLRQLFEVKPTMAEAFASSVWFEDDGKTLRDEFNPKKGTNPKKSKASKKG